MPDLVGDEDRSNFKVREFLGVLSPICFEFF